MSLLLQMTGTTFVVQQAVNLSPTSLKRAEVKNFSTIESFLLMQYNKLGAIFIEN